jgi:7-carboxy-7-deazaguanine synthase
MIMEAFQVAETFVSINGEGKKAGRLAMFVRLKGCNLNCSYCDTRWANEKNAAYELMTSAQIADRVRKAGVELVTLTGGEPLLDDNIGELIGSLLMIPHVEVEIETNGSVPIRFFKQRDARLSMTMDYKLPSSNMEEEMCLENMEYLKPWDVVKFVIGSREDLERAKEIIERFSLCEKAIVYFSPVFGRIEPEEIVEYMKEERLNKVRFQIQIHKVVWDPNKTGV